MIRPLRLLFLALALTGCRKPEIHSYLAPKDVSLESTAAMPAQEKLPQLSWTLPPGWAQTQPGQMSVASFRTGEGEDAPTVAITPLPNLSGQEEAIVNMWREQMKLGPLSPEEVAKALVPTPVAGGEGKVFELLGERDGKSYRTIAAMLHRSSRSWFFKLSGPDATVTAQKQAFLDFVKSVRFSSSSETAAAAPSSSAQDEPKSSFGWAVPPAWKPQTAGAMQVAKFSVPPQGDAKADVSVSIFPSESGGTLANVNRWRKQIGLPEVDEAGLAACTSPLDSIPGAVVVDLKSDPRALLGAIVPRGSRFFFYKLLGDASAVGAAREDFLGFVKSEP
jgi:hypothetical protein